MPFYGAQTYGKKFLQQAGPAAEGTKIGLIFAVPEDGRRRPSRSSTPGTSARRRAPTRLLRHPQLGRGRHVRGGPAPRRAPIPTQAKILAEMRKVTSYTGDGMVAGINPAQKKQPKCFHILEVKGGKWVKTFPAKGFQC